MIIFGGDKIYLIMKKLLLILLCLPMIGFAQIDLLNKVSKKAQNIIPSKRQISETDVKNGLTEALIRGSQISVNKASSFNGFYLNNSLKILMPKEAKKMKEKLIKLGFKKHVDDFELSMNRAAENASKDALNIFAEAINNITIRDAFSILNGENDAATNYLKKETHQFLYNSCKPIIRSAMKGVSVSKQWTFLVTQYNAIPLTEKINPDLEDYITNKAVNGLFVLIALEEIKIRKNPSARTSEILKKVFN